MPAGDAQSDDQVDWDRCRSYRRLYLALRDAGVDVSPVVELAVDRARQALHPDRAKCTCLGSPYGSPKCVSCAFMDMDDMLASRNGCGCLYPVAVRLIGLLGEECEHWMAKLIKEIHPVAPPRFNDLGTPAAGRRSPKAGPDPSPRAIPNKIHGA